jgi:hypothetical protein
MADWLYEFYIGLTWAKIFLGFGLFAGSLLLSTLSVAVVMIKVPANYFSETHSREFLPGSSWHVRWSAMVLKNILGIVLVLLGILLSLPGVPGQGILTILLGLIMIDIPGKRPWEARIVKRPRVLSAINALRARYQKSPLILD